LQPAEMATRMARPAGQADPPDHHLKAAAAAITGHIASRDEGAIRRFLHKLEHETGPGRVNPWQLLECLTVTLCGARRVSRSATTSQNQRG
jgi:hypothetical protein